MTTNRPRSGVVVTPGMHRLLAALLIAFAVLVIDSVYLGTISFLEWRSGETLQGFTYQIAFLLHLALGFATLLLRWCIASCTFDAPSIDQID